MLKSITLVVIFLVLSMSEPIRVWKKQDIPTFKPEQFVVRSPIPAYGIENNFEISKLGSLAQIQLFSKEKQQKTGQAEVPPISLPTKNVNNVQFIIRDNIKESALRQQNKEENRRVGVLFVENGISNNLRKVLKNQQINWPYSSIGRSHLPFQYYWSDGGFNYGKKYPLRSYYLEPVVQPNIRSYATNYYYQAQNYPPTSYYYPYN